MESYLPRDFCPYARGVLGHLSEIATVGGEAVLAIAGSCDAMRRVYDTVRIYLPGLKVYYVDVPRTCDEHAVDYYAGVLREFRRNIRGGDEDAGLESLRSAVALMNRFRETVTGWFQWARESSEGRPWTRAVQVLLDANDRLANDEPPGFASPPAHQGRPHPDGQIRVVVSGTTCLDTTVISAVEEAGMRILSIDSCLGERSVSFRVEEEDPEPFRALARRYLQKIVCPRMLDHDRRKARFHRLLESETGDRAGPDGLVYFVPKFCDPGYYDYAEARSCASGIGLPVLALEGEFAAGRTSQVRTRLLAFREMLETRRSRTLIRSAASTPEGRCAK